MKLIDFNKAHEQKEAERLKDWFMNEIMPHLSHADKIALMEALDNRSEEDYKKITEPIIRRNVMWESNKSQ